LSHEYVWHGIAQIPTLTTTLTLIKEVPGWMLVVEVQTPSFSVLTLALVYTPAESPAQRVTFFTKHFQDTVADIVLGDFNCVLRPEDSSSSKDKSYNPEALLLQSILQ